MASKIECNTTGGRYNRFESKPSGLLVLVKLVTPFRRGMDMGVSNLERAVAQLQVQSIASRQLITQLLVLVALDNPLGDGVFKYLSDMFEITTQDESDPEFGTAIGREINSLIEQAKILTQRIRHEMSK